MTSIDNSPTGKLTFQYLFTKGYFKCYPVGTISVIINTNVFYFPVTLVHLSTYS